VGEGGGGAGGGGWRRRLGAAVVREREWRRRRVRDPQLGRRRRAGLERDAAVEQRNRPVVAIERGHDAADVGCRGGGARQHQRDERTEEPAGHWVSLSMCAKACCLQMESLAPPLSCPAKAGHPVTTENLVVTGSPAFAGDDDRGVNDPSKIITL